MNPGDMLAQLAMVEKVLPSLIKQGDLWHSLDVNYEPPRVERLWMQLNDLRVYLHIIHPCQEALFHPHPWPSAIKILRGTYEMGIGFGRGRKSPPKAATVNLTKGATYEMIDPNGWHYVRPPSTQVYSIMITGKPWNRWSPGPKPEVKLGPLSEDGRFHLLKVFDQYYRDENL